MSSLDLLFDDREVAQKIEALLKVADGDEKVMGKIETALDQLVRATFRTEVDPYGVAWDRWAHPAAMERKRQKRGDFGAQILVDFGDMFDSIQSGHDANSVFLSIGDGLPDARAVWQQFGVLEHNLPSRKMVPQKSPDETEYPQSWIDQIMKPLTDMFNTVLQ